MVKKYIAGKIIKGGKKVIDFIDDKFPLGKGKMKSEATATNRKPGEIQKGIIRQLDKRPDRKNYSVLKVNLPFKDGKRARSGSSFQTYFSESKGKDGIGRARKYIKDQLHLMYGKDVKILTEKAFLDAAKLHKGKNMEELADILKSQNYISVSMGARGASYKLVDHNVIRNLVNTSLADKATVKSFVKANPANLTVPKKLTEKHWLVDSAATTLRTFTNKLLSHHLPKQQKLVLAQQKDAARLNKLIKNKKGKAANEGLLWDVDHVNALEIGRRKLGVGFGGFIKYLRNRHGLYGKEYSGSQRVLNAASKIYKDTHQRGKLFDDFIREKLAINPTIENWSMKTNSKRILKDFWGAGNTQTVQRRFHGADFSRKLGESSKTSYFDDWKGTLKSLERNNLLDANVKKHINLVRVAEKKSKTEFNKAMLKGFKETEDNIFDISRGKVFEIEAPVKLRSIKRNSAGRSIKFNEQLREAQEWFKGLAPEAKTAYAYDSKGLLSEATARIPSPSIKLLNEGGRIGMDEGGRVGMQIGGSPKPV